jgi:hypothetical protein
VFDDAQTWAILLMAIALPFALRFWLVFVY